MSLPAALARWRQQLQPFAEDLAGPLGKLVVRLAPTIDALLASRLEPGDDVDGFDGIASRGSYERLLSSDWALRQSAPLEFLRRAASGEHNFYQLAWRKPAAPDGVLLLFDAGPDQLGGCRIVQLAILVLLSERCRARGRPLHWQLLHHVGEPLRTDLDEAGVRAFLDGRTPLRSSASAVQAWREQVARHRAWLVGPAATVAHADARFVRVTLRQPLLADAERVTVSLEDGGQKRSLTLDLPEASVSARLLRDPFQQARVPTQSGKSRLGKLLLSPSGTRLFHATPQGSLVSIPIRNSPRANAGAPRVYQAQKGFGISSVARWGRHLAWLACADDQLCVDVNSGRKRRELLPQRATGPTPRRLGNLAWFNSELMALYVADDGSLVRTDFRTGKSVRVAHGVRAWVTYDGRQLVAVDRAEGDPSGAARLLALGPYRDDTLLQHARWEDAALALPGQPLGITLGVAMKGVWTLTDFRSAAGQLSRSPGAVSLSAPAGTTVLGIEPFYGGKPPGLWLLEENRREISIARLRSASSVLKTQSPIVETSLSSAAPLVAVSTESGELVVVNRDGTVLHRSTT